MQISSLRFLRLTTITAACLILAGCQLWPFKDRADQPPPEESPQPSVKEAKAPDPSTVESAMDLLQAGEEADARKILERLEQQRPGDQTLRLLLAQIRQPPEELLGERFEEVIVQPGESLSAIAGRTIGNELLFYSLARLNEIEEPRLLRPGQRLRVPVPEPAEPESEPDEPAQPGPRPAVESGPRDDGQAGLEDTARGLLERERYSQAYALLLSAARADRLSPSGRALLADAAVALSNAACAQDDPDKAGKYLRQASPWLSRNAAGGAFARQRAHVDARLRLGEAERLLAAEEVSGAYNALIAARELDPDLADTHGPRLRRVESTLGQLYHDRALSAWRDQQVDRSVELWDRVVTINPRFEPAVRYLERARRAQRKLEALESG
jgi:hypothetical protein